MLLNSIVMAESQMQTFLPIHLCHYVSPAYCDPRCLPRGELRFFSNQELTSAGRLAYVSSWLAEIIFKSHLQLSVSK